MSETAKLEKTIVVLEGALEETDQTLALLLGFINRDEELRAQLYRAGVSASFLTINHSCGRNDRNVKHLEKSWDKPMGPSNKTSFQDFTLTRAYESVLGMGLYQQGHYCAALDLDSCTELVEYYKGVLMYGLEQECYIGCLHDGSYMLDFHGTRACGPALGDIEELLYEAAMDIYNEE